MRRLIPILALLYLALPTHGAVVQSKTGTGTSLTLTSATTVGDALAVGLSSTTANAGTVKIGTQTLSLDGQCAPVVVGNFTCIYETARLTVASTAVSCTGCGTGNAIGAVEYSGTDGSNVEPVVGCIFTSTTLCQQNSGGTTVGIRYQPGYSAEDVFFMSTCAGSSTAPTLNNLTSTGSAIPNGNAIAWGVSSGTAVTSMVPSSGCPGSGGAALLAMAFPGSGATPQPIANPNNQSYSAQCTSGSCTVSAFVFNVGDLVAVHIWGKNNYGVTTLTLGSQTVTCPAGTQGTTNANAGQPWICYALATAAGSQTITFTPSGTPTDFQVAYQDFTVSLNTTISFDKGAISNCVSSCSEGTTVALPSITPTHTGSLLVNFVATQSHTVAPAGSWSCYSYIASGQTQDCTMVTTKNVAAWILSSSAGATTPQMTILNANDPYQSSVASFSLLAPSAAGPQVHQAVIF